MKFLTDEQLRTLLPAETASFPSPVPTQIVSSDEYLPVAQTAEQRRVEARLKELSDGLAKRQGLSRPRFFQRSEERRGGKKGRSRWSPYHLKKKTRYEVDR